MQTGTTGALGDSRSLRVISVPPSARMALGVLSAMLDLPRGAVSDLLDHAPVLLPVPPGQDARRVRMVLMALGLRVADVGTDLDDRIDLCLQPKPGADIDQLAQVLQPLLAPVVPLCGQALRAGLAAPDGLILPSLTAPAVDQLCRRLRRLRRLRQLSVLQSRCQDSQHDLFGPVDSMIGLAAHLRLLGHGEDPQTGALAAGFDWTVASHLRRRFPQARVVDRAFQRFDLLLTRIDVAVSDEIADFLTARTGLRQDRFGLVSPAAPLRLETGLLRASALRFRKDYAAIGLQTVLALPEPAMAE